MSGWRATCQGKKIGGRWIEGENLLHINQLELKAAFLALQAFSKNLSNKHILIQLDNKTATTYINKMGWDCIKTAHTISNSNLGVVFAEESNSHLRIYPRKVQFDCRLGKQKFHRQQQLEVEPKHFQKSMALFGQ